MELDRERKAKLLVASYFNLVTRLDTPGKLIALGDVKLVWFSKTLQNWKACLITLEPDDTYYEVTYNGDKEEFYLDVYEKQVNMRVTDAQLYGEEPIDWPEKTEK